MKEIPVARIKILIILPVNLLNFRIYSVILNPKSIVVKLTSRNRSSIVNIPENMLLKSAGLNCMCDEIQNAR